MRRLTLTTSLFALLAISACKDDTPTDDTSSEAEGIDEDGDGHSPNPSDGAPADCDDTDPTAHPDATELCDGVDNDCDGAVDNDAEDGLTVYADGDEDGFGDPDTSTRVCQIADGWARNDDDCDDNNDNSNPDAEEICDGEDNDCDGRLPADEEDLDRDGLPNCSDTDRDGDGLSNSAEENGDSGHVTDPDLADTDGDGVDDGVDGAPLSPHCAGETYYETQFDSGDNMWEVVSGDFLLDEENGNYFAYNDPVVDGEAAWLWSGDWTDMVVETRVRLGANGFEHNGGLIFRVQFGGNTFNNSQHAYWVGLMPYQDMVQFGVLNGSWRELAMNPYPLDPDTWYTLRVEAIGDQIDIFVDGNNVVSMQDSTYSHGSVGLRTWWMETHWDNLLVCH